MLTSLRKFLLLVVCITSYNSLAIADNKVNIVMITNPNFHGKTDEIIGVTRILEQKLKQKNYVPIVHRVSSDEHKITLPFTHSIKDNSIIIIASGYKGLKHLRDLKRHYGEKILTVHLDHQMLEEQVFYTKKYKGDEGIDIFALPESSIVEDFEKRMNKSQLIKTIGVAHSWTMEDIQENFECHKDYFQNLQGKRVVLIMLPGDTQNTKDSWRCFTEREAKLHANELRNFIPKDSIVLVINGWRTGMIDPLTMTRRALPASPTPDPVSQAFLEELKTSIPSNQIIFHHYKSEIPLKAMVGFVKNNSNSQMWIPGEAKFLISQVIDFIPFSQLKINTHSAMNEFHYRFLKSIDYTRNHKEKVIIRGPLARETFMFKCYVPKSHKNDRKIIRAGDQIAQAITKTYIAMR
jgi:hypothetical protein